LQGGENGALGMSARRVSGAVHDRENAAKSSHQGSARSIRSAKSFASEKWLTTMMTIPSRATPSSASTQRL
jgi:hypothetical protein